MVHFVGAGPGAVDLITVRGAELLKTADVVVYAGSLVNPALLEYCGEACETHDSAKLTLEEVLAVIRAAEAKKKTTVRLHTGDPSLYGAIREQMDALDEERIPYDVVPGVSSFLGAAAALRMEYTLPGVSQSVILTRMAGRTQMPAHETIEAFAAHRATMAIFLSAAMAAELQKRLIAGGYPEKTPAAIVYKATWPEERCFRCTVGTLEKTAAEEGVARTALVLVGEAVAQRSYERSRLYDPEFSTAFRERG